uniref:Uncharacterized protein n=1 Tax=Oryza nivara TaxID=4536 RepID=A0A0E0H1X6_ORYNI
MENSKPTDPDVFGRDTIFLAGLVAAKEENRRTAKEPAIIVPSRYRQVGSGCGGGRDSGRKRRRWRRGQR